MSDLISKSAAQAIPPLPKCYREYATSNLDDAYDNGWEDALFSLNALPTIDSVPVVRCKDCKHRPTRPGNAKRSFGFGLVYPDDICPSQCDDPWYSQEPDDDWFCANGERK